MVLMLLEVLLVVLEVVLVVLKVTGPEMPWGNFQIRLSLRPDLSSPAPPTVCVSLATIPVWELPANRRQISSRSNEKQCA